MCNSNDPELSNCDMCLDPNKCSQCKPGFNLRNFKCVSTCDVSDRIIKSNNLCYRTSKCLVEDCLECEGNNPSVCAQCNNGMFLHNNMCHVSCPGALRADRINWSCLEDNVFSWYWIFPSKSSCRSSCGMPMGANRDCSCEESCIHYGNCCQDVEDYCYKFVGP